MNAWVSLGFFQGQMKSGVFGHSGAETVEQVGDGDADEGT